MPIDALSPELVLTAYRAGIFPMADPREDNAIYWYAPDARAIIPLDGLHVSTSLARTVKSAKFTVQLDRDFAAVMRACAQPRPTQPETWISAEILRVYTQLHQLGHAHSVECWQDGALVGGLYGVALGGAFFGESMFHVARDASKVALVHLVAHLKARGYTLLDTQFLTPHLQRMGAKVITKRDYERRLALALKRKVTWFEPVPQPAASPQPT